MKLLFRQRLFSWLDSYDIYDEEGRTAFTVQGKLAWGHKFVILDPTGREVGMVKEVILTFLPQFELYCNGNYIGRIQKEFSFFRPRYNIECNGWHVEGSFMEWDYTIQQGNQLVATVSKELFHLTDHYSMDIVKPEDALCVLMLVLAIDAEKCSRQ